jgi:hypothetical protein
MASRADYNESEVGAMQAPREPKPDSGSGDAAQQVAGAHALLKALEGKIGEHPEIGQAIHKLETALNILGLETGAML